LAKYKKQDEPALKLFAEVAKNAWFLQTHLCLAQDNGLNIIQPYFPNYQDIKEQYGAGSKSWDKLADSDIFEDHSLVFNFLNSILFAQKFL